MQNSNILSPKQSLTDDVVQTCDFKGLSVLDGTIDQTLKQVIVHNPIGLAGVTHQYGSISYSGNDTHTQLLVCRGFTGGVVTNVAYDRSAGLTALSKAFDHHSIIQCCCDMTLNATDVSYSIANTRSFLVEIEINSGTNFISQRTYRYLPRSATGLYVDLPFPWFYVPAGYNVTFYFRGEDYGSLSAYSIALRAQQYVARDRTSLPLHLLASGAGSVQSM